MGDDPNYFDNFIKHLIRHISNRPMKKSLFTVLIFMVNLLPTHTVRCQTTTLNFDFEEAAPINARLTGFNTGPTFNEIFESSASVVSIVDKCAILPPPFNTFNDYKIISFTPKAEMVTKTAALKPATLRFPGGTISNFYHLYEYTGETYNPDSPTFAAGCGTQDVETSILGGVIRDQFCQKDARVQLDDPSANPNYIAGFVNYVLAVEDEVHASGDTDFKVDIIFVPNIFAHFQKKILLTILKEDHLIPSDPTDPLNITDPSAIFELYYKECKDALDYLIEHDLNVVGVEFGNELFFPFYQTTNSNVTPETYMQLCDIYSQRLKVAYPTLKFGILSEPSNPTWNNSVAAYSPQFYDAVALHDYYNENTCITEDAPCETGCETDYTTDRTCRFDCGKCALGNYIRHDLNSLFSEALAPFPAETKLWLTEWGIISPNGLTGSNLDYMNTFLYSCFTQEHLLAQLEFNTNAANRITFSTHHRIGYHNRWSVVQTRLGTLEATEQSNFHTYAFFKKMALAETVNAYDGMTILDLADTNTLTAKSFIVRENADSNPKIMIYYSNKTTANVPLTVESFATTMWDGNFYFAEEMGKTSFLKAADSTALYASFGKTKFNEIWHDNTDDPSLFVSEDLTIDLSGYSLPSLSAGVIEIELSPLVNLHESQPNFSFKLYPNPGSDMIHVICSQEIIAENMTITNLTGKTVKTIQISANQPPAFSSTDLESGVYLVQINHNKGKETLRFFKP